MSVAEAPWALRRGRLFRATLCVASPGHGGSLVRTCFLTVLHRFDLFEPQIVVG